MTDYQELRIEITPCSEEATDLLAAFLADEGYESFVPDDKGLTAYIQADSYDPAVVQGILDDFPMPLSATYIATKVEGRDWNHEWEKNYFKPIIVGGECVVHSSFHTDIPQAKYDIVIDPKMAFGTGHHATTSLIIEYLLAMPMHGKRIIDMGTGTGILAILCAKAGATDITGIEIDEGAWENAVDNAALNGTSFIHMIHGDAHALQAFAMLDAIPSAQADLLIANINRNIILSDLSDYAAAIRPGAQMILCGFYTQDIPLIEQAAAMHGLRITQKKERDNWCALLLQKA